MNKKSIEKLIRNNFKNIKESQIKKAAHYIYLGYLESKLKPIKK